MKATLKSTLAMITVCLTLFSNAVPMWAGMVQVPEISIIFDDFLYVTGSMVGVRYSQYIGCLFYETLFEGFVSCTARDKTGKSFTGFCTSLGIENYSKYLK